MTSPNEPTSVATPPERRATVEWRPVELERLLASRVVTRSLMDIERVLSVGPDQVVQLAYGKSVDANGAVISLSPYPALPWLRVPVRVEFSTPVGEHHGAVISIRWAATRMPHLFPTMEADLLVRPEGSGGECELVLDGRYRPPLGFLGLILDRLFGRWVASTTARTFLDRLGDCIEPPLRKRREHADGIRHARLGLRFAGQRRSAPGADGRWRGRARRQVHRVG